MATNARVFILREPVHAHSLIAFLKENAGEQARIGRPLEVRVSVYREKRSSGANALMWVWLGQIADQVRPNGQRFDAEVWNGFFKRELLPEETARGVKKWRLLPNGERELFMSTSDLDVEEMGTYLTAMQAHAATEFGLRLESLAEV